MQFVLDQLKGVALLSGVFLVLFFLFFVGAEVSGNSQSFLLRVSPSVFVIVCAHRKGWGGGGGGGGMVASKDICSFL